MFQKRKNSNSKPQAKRATIYKERSTIYGQTFKISNSDDVRQERSKCNNVKT